MTTPLRKSRTSCGGEKDIGIIRYGIRARPRWYTSLGIPRNSTFHITEHTGYSYRDSPRNPRINFHSCSLHGLATQFNIHASTKKKPQAKGKRNSTLDPTRPNFQLAVFWISSSHHYPGCVDSCKPVIHLFVPSIVLISRQSPLSAQNLSLVPPFILLLVLFHTPSLRLTTAHNNRFNLGIAPL